MTDYTGLVNILCEARDWATKDGGIPIGLIYRLGQAADAIEELQQIAGHYQEEAKEWYLAYMDLLPTRWISVEERLPEIGEKVLVWYRWQGEEKYSIAIDKIGITNRHATEPHWVNHPAGKINFWMPLPEPPKEG